MRLSLSFAAFLTFFAASCSNISRFPASATYPIEVVGGDEKSFTPVEPSATPTPFGKDFDVVVVGGGLAGLSASIFLSEAGKSVLLLEKEPTFGGLAQGTTFPGTNINFDRGAAYWTSAYEEELEILKRIGLGDYETKHSIPEPIDSYLWKGNFYPGIWEKETLGTLPASFALFRSELKKANEAQLIPNQPMEEAPHQDLDHFSAAAWIRSMPALAAKRTDSEAKQVYARFLKERKEGALDKQDPMSGVIGLIDLYCRSALGTKSGGVSAMAFANFYISEIETRYTTQIGTAQAAENMVKLLQGRAIVSMQPASPVLKVVQDQGGVATVFAQNGKAFQVRSKFLVYAGQVKFAPQIIEGLAAQSPEQAKLMSSLGYANYSVHAVEVKGHPYRATYDTWTKAADATDEDFTDVILGRWMDPVLDGYAGYRDFVTSPPGNSIMTIYHPLSAKHMGQGYTVEQAKELASSAVERMLELYNPFLEDRWKTQLEVLSVQTSRWPFSVHIAEPGHFLRKAKILRRPFGKVFFANNNLGTPAFEEALFRGHCAANNVLKRLDAAFAPEKWSQCPMEP